MESVAMSESAVLVNEKGLWASWKEDIRCVFERDPAARNTLEVLTTYPGVHAVLMHRLSNRLWKANWRYLARLVSFMVRILTNVDIHPGATIGQRLFIDHGAGVVIGETAEIGNDVTLYHGVTLGGTSWNKGKRHPSLGDRVLVGAGAKILGPVMIESDARVGANSVVVRDVPEGCTVVGIPGRIVNESASGRKAAGINLNHHLIPDPVGRALSCLLERIDKLEAQLEAKGELDSGYQLEFYGRCEKGSDICEDDCPEGQRITGKH